MEKLYLRNILIRKHFSKIFVPLWRLRKKIKWFQEHTTVHERVNIVEF